MYKSSQKIISTFSPSLPPPARAFQAQEEPTHLMIGKRSLHDEMPGLIHPLCSDLSMLGTIDLRTADSRRGQLE